MAIINSTEYPVGTVYKYNNTEIYYLNLILYKKLQNGYMLIKKLKL